MCFISLFKLLCDEPASIVHAEQHQNTNIVTGKTAVSPLSFLTMVLLQTLERQEHGKCFSCCSITAINGASVFLEELFQATVGLEMLGLGLQ